MIEQGNRLQGKREEFHISIRKHNKGNTQTANRFKFINQNITDLQRLMDIDCIKSIQDLKREDNYFKL